MSLLFGRALALENSNLQHISEFLSTCQIQSNRVLLSNSIPTYRDGIEIEDDINYLILQEENIIGILTDTDGILTYTDLTTKFISSYKFKQIKAIEYIDLDIVVYLDNTVYSIINNTFSSNIQTKYDLLNLNTQEIHLR